MEAGEIKGEFFLVLFPKQKNSFMEKILSFWKEVLISLEEDYTFVLFYHMSLTEKMELLERLKNAECIGCISEIFEEICTCKCKKEVLKQIDSLGVYSETRRILEERDLYTESLYAYAASLIHEAGLYDYEIEELAESDNENNTELYETLKMYLLCDNNLLETAAMLHIHRNTLVYRLKQIQKYVERDFNDLHISGEMLAYMMLREGSKRQR